MNNRLMIYPVIAILGASGIVSYSLDRAVENVQQHEPMEAENMMSSMPSAAYNDGEYTNKVNYIARGQRESIEVSLTIEDGVISGVDSTHSGSHHVSISYQQSFDLEIDSSVVGVDIDGISLSRIGGASDTTNAFVRALGNIKNEAS